MAKKSKWGTTSERRRYANVGDWRIQTEKFNCTDGTFFFRVKFAKNDWAFNDPSASYLNWHSSPPRKRKEFQSHQEAYDWGISEIEKQDKSMS